MRRIFTHRLISLGIAMALSAIACDQRHSAETKDGSTKLGIDATANKQSMQAGSVAKGKKDVLELERSENDRMIDLNDLWKLNEYASDKLLRFDANVDEMEPYVKMLHPKNGFHRIKSGEIVFKWSDDFFERISLAERGKVRVAWDRDPDSKGNVAVLFGDGMTRMVSHKRLDSAPMIDEIPHLFRQAELRDIWGLNIVASIGLDRFARSVDELQPKNPNKYEKKSYQRMLDGEIAFSWTDDFYELPEKRRSEFVVLWETKPDKNNRVSVLFGNGMTKTVDLEEFKKLPKAPAKLQK